MEDDGSLASLNIPPDDSKKYFHCDETTQQKLLNKSFWVVDFIENVTTRYGSERYLVKIKFDMNDSEENTRKFFTNSREIKYILDKVRELVNKYSVRFSIPQKDIWDRIYQTLYYNYHIALRSYARKKSESLMDVAERVGALEKMYAIISNMARQNGLVA